MMMLDCRRSSRENTPFWPGERTSGKHEEIARRARGVLVVVERVADDIGRIVDEKHRETTNETMGDEWTAGAGAGRTCTARLQSALCTLRSVRTCWRGRPDRVSSSRVVGGDGCGDEDRRLTDTVDGRMFRTKVAAAVTGYNIIIIIILSIHIGMFLRTHLYIRLATGATGLFFFFYADNLLPSQGSIVVLLTVKKEYESTAVTRDVLMCMSEPSC